MSQHGMTLIETLIVIALMGLLAVAGMSFTGNWVDSNRVLDGSNMLSQANARAKAAALRNEFGITEDDPAAALCLANNVLSVRGATGSDKASCASSNILWSATLNERLQINTGGAAFSCACLNNKGRFTDTECAGCATGNTYSLSSGNENAEISLF